MSGLTLALKVHAGCEEGPDPSGRDDDEPASVKMLSGQPPAAVESGDAGSSGLSATVLSHDSPAVLPDVSDVPDDCRDINASG